MTISTTPRPIRRDPSLWRRLVAVLRGLVGVLVAVLRVTVAAPAALLSALFGTPPGWLRRFGRRIADRYRLGYYDAEDVTVVDAKDAPVIDPEEAR
ncbi:hypothetical protein amrb99_36960 [Actinomadura sp. RB99]|uniref:hypothetical protein n=1 Tax=Actinomadura sp. RB99 TaxID=2691577 RepID=UPI00168452AF|nr:hypothetical protein [Actinomadura sp. RB99]MBD2894769.1 hypothetical protein [Actinomadura sp. RB99]